MKSFLVACAVAVIIAAGAGFVLNGIQKPAEEAYATTGVRLGS